MPNDATAEPQPAPLQISTVWQRLDPETAAAVVSFWVAQQAMSEEIARQRVAELVCVARNRSAEIVGVSTAVVAWIAHLQLPCFYFRMFVAPDSRTFAMTTQLLRQSAQSLAVSDEARQADGPKGVFLEIHNTKLNSVWTRPVQRVFDLDFIYVGRSPQGHQLRVHYFPGRGARLPQIPG